MKVDYLNYLMNYSINMMNTIDGHRQPETLCQALPGARSSVPRIHSRMHALPGERVLDREPLHSQARTHGLKYFREAGETNRHQNPI